MEVIVFARDEVFSSEPLNRAQSLRPELAGNHRQAGGGQLDSNFGNRSLTDLLGVVAFTVETLSTSTKSMAAPFLAKADLPLPSPLQVA